MGQQQQQQVQPPVWLMQLGGDDPLVKAALQGLWGESFFPAVEAVSGGFIE